MTHSKTIARLLLTGLLAAPAACSSGGDVNIGDTQSLGAKLSDYAAHWDGYAEAYAFPPSNSDRIRLVLDDQGNGTVQVGDDPLLPAPTDPNLGYPAGDENTKTSGDINRTTLSGGVVYPVYAAQVQAARIQIGLKPLDYYAAWCALQTSYHVIDGFTAQADGSEVPDYTYGCLPGYGGSGGSTGCEVQINNPDQSVTYQPADCGKLYLCLMQVCACDATGCSTGPSVAAGTAPAGYPAELDAALDSSGENMTGTLNLNGTRLTVHLQRQ